MGAQGRWGATGSRQESGNTCLTWGPVALERVLQGAPCWPGTLSLSHRKHLPSWADPGVSAREHLQEVLMGLGAASSWGLLCTQTLKTQMFEKYTCFLF